MNSINQPTLKEDRSQRTKAIKRKRNTRADPHNSAPVNELAKVIAESLARRWAQQTESSAGSAADSA